MLCSLQKRLTVSVSHRDAPSSSSPSAAGEEQRDSLILPCDTGGWRGARGTGSAPAAPGGTKCRVPGTILLPRPGQRCSPHRCPSDTSSMGKLWLRCGATGKAERQVPTASPSLLCSGLSLRLQHTTAPLCLLHGTRGRWEGWSRTSPLGLPQCSRAG